MIDETGNTHGRLTVLRFVGKSPRRRHIFLTRCECGNERKVLGQHLRANQVTECRVCAKVRRTNAIKRYFLPNH